MTRNSKLQSASARTVRKFLSAEWRDLVMLNYRVDPALLQSLVPVGTMLDLWKGDALVSVVAFQFLKTRVLGIPVPWHRDFEEVNLRFYVRREMADGVRRGVVFIRELVPRRAIAWTARALYNEPYRAARMRHTIAEREERRMLEYAWQLSSRWTRVTAHTDGAPQVLVTGSEEEFITEHYWGYTPQRDGSTMEYHVEHPSWRVWRAREASLNGDIEQTYGAEFAEVLGGSPQSAFVAEGSPITVYKPQRLLLTR